MWWAVARLAERWVYAVRGRPRPWAIFFAVVFTVLTVLRGCGR